MKPIELGRYEHIETAWCEPRNGPGWANRPLWYIVSDCGVLRRGCLQPDEQDAVMLHLYDVCAAAHESLVRAVEARVVKKDKEAQQ